ncbi:IucA/IucC family protein [Brevibacillus sp. SYSU BS000544]|uniref:IucA/IucC family protein n=1 Tax=Brevibacillus sp. SYSU BS000544 TaxID=3416443 RepID=UPI003CE45641
MTRLEDVQHSKQSLDHELAEQATIERIVNAYLRENGIFDPRLEKNGSQLSLPFETDNFFYLHLPKSSATLVGELTFWSAGGHHSYGSSFYQVKEFTYSKLDGHQILQLILDELSMLETDESIRHHKKNELLHHMQNSVQNTISYIRKSRSTPNRQNQPLDFLLSEQSLYYGHPFHPTPKSQEGFTQLDMHRFSPELGTSFTLHYLAVSPEFIREEWVHQPNVNHAETCIPQSIRDEAASILGVDKIQYELLPCHPWQANYLLQQKHFQDLLHQEKIIDLGPLGNRVYPTSSVRTVWDPSHNYFFKLPLQIRITNFIRVNTYEQVKRTIDASKIVAEVKDRFENEQFQVLMDYGFRTVSLAEIPDSENERVMEAAAVVFRGNPEELRRQGSTIFVVGSLMETPPGEAEPTLFKAIRQNKENQLPSLTNWFQQYLTISMLPILTMFAEAGISLEAHAQNSLVMLEKGLPVRLYVRDLEGISIDRDMALRHGWTKTLIATDSPVLYQEEEAWFRLQYYFFVNHLGYVVRTLAKYSNQDEYVFWRVARNVLLEESKKTPSERMTKYINDLLHRKTLPAKANFVSRFQKIGETPLYVQIPNPIHFCQVTEHTSLTNEEVKQ